MSFYIILYLILIMSFITLWTSVIKKYKDLSGYYFLLFSLSVSIWLGLYFISYYIFNDPNILLLISKLWYFISIVCIFSFLYFIYYFSTGSKDIFSNKNKFIHIFWFVLFFIYIFTDNIIQWMYFDSEKKWYYEIAWNLHDWHILITLIFFPLFAYTTYKKYSSINFLNKLRLKYILFWTALFITLTLIFQLILPLFDIWLFEKEIWLFFIPFILLSFYSIHRYNLSNIKIKIGEWIVYLCSLLITIFVVNILKHYAVIFWNDFMRYWEISQNFWFLDLTLWILIFSINNYILKKIILNNATYWGLARLVHQFKKEIPNQTNIADLNTYLQDEFSKNLHVEYCSITLFNEEKKELEYYFEKYKHLWIFINDVVFLEENKNKFNIAEIKSEISDAAYIVFPLYNDVDKIEWIFSIGRKKFQEHYYADEISILWELNIFIQSHIKYIQISKKVHALSVNLDQQVDKQTFEYNQLINKQKEFINLISHEVKWPIASSIFQIDTIIDDFNEWNISNKNLSKELNILNSLLLKTGDLVNKLFSIQQFEMNTQSLFIEQVKVTKLLEEELIMFKKRYPEIIFHWDFDNSIGYIQLDKVQFRQVIDNLINNSIKVIKKIKWEIFVSCKIVWDNIEIIFEDNWKWFTDIEVQKIFDKYSTWSGSSIWLWMWLYLCKTIVELHWWNIQASFWKKLWWARIIITIPK